MFRKLFAGKRPKGLILTTYDHTSPVDKSTAFDGRNGYGLVYSKALEKLAADGWTIESMDIPRQTAKFRSSIDSLKRIDQIVSEMEARDPTLVFHDPNSFAHQMWHLCRSANSDYSEDTLDYVKELTSASLEERLYASFRGKVERVETTFGRDLEGDTSNKRRFYEIAEQLGVPIPKSVILVSDDDPMWNYEALLHSFGDSRENSIILKAARGNSGKDVYLIKNQDEFDTFLRETRNETSYWIAQERIPLPNDVPYSIRVIMWGDSILGAALLCNPNDEYRSNAKKGGVAVDLGVRLFKTRTSALQLPEDFDAQKLYEIAKVCKIDLDRRKLPKEIAELSRTIGGHPTSYLIKGIDFMYRDGNPVALEVNRHPGPPGTGMYSSLFGMPKQNRNVEIEVTAELLRIVISRYI